MDYMRHVEDNKSKEYTEVDKSNLDRIKNAPNMLSLAGAEYGKDGGNMVIHYNGRKLAEYSDIKDRNGYAIGSRSKIYVLDEKGYPIGTTEYSETKQERERETKDSSGKLLSKERTTYSDSSIERTYEELGKTLRWENTQLDKDGKIAEQSRTEDKYDKDGKWTGQRKEKDVFEEGKRKNWLVVERTSEGDQEWVYDQENKIVSNLFKDKHGNMMDIMEKSFDGKKSEKMKGSFFE